MKEDDWRKDSPKKRVFFRTQPSWNTQREVGFFFLRIPLSRFGRSREIQSVENDFPPAEGTGSRFLLNQRERGNGAILPPRRKYGLGGKSGGQGALPPNTHKDGYP